uniref:Uncharacterized protein n=1 Tax=Arundo donax TaxID=35708 RepID=A0A0A9BD76_ARUDO
MVRLRDPMF